MSLYAEQFDSPFRWTVRSRSEGKHAYLADLLDWDCQCKDFTIRHRKAVKEGGCKLEHSCWHLRCAAEAWWDAYVEPNLTSIPVVRNLDRGYIDKNKLRLAIALLADVPRDKE